jgi:GH15 family glucan-1,4-alpha-glucosidase
VLYDLFGRARIGERDLDHLSGYRHSRPVRVGNAAVQQLQLDVYGEVIGAAHEFVMRGGRLARWQLRQLRGLGETVCKRWQEPDAGIWEVRSNPRHHVHSKVMCWRALDNLLTMHAHSHLSVPVDHFRSVRDAIGAAIETEGYSETVQSYAQAFGGQAADASLLRLPAQGYVEAGAPRMRSTYTYLEAQLCQSGLWYRYRPDGGDGLSGREGAFGVCSFWAAEYLAQRGETELAQIAFERVLACANDVGLFAEEMDPETGAALGNFPQAFTHIGLINAALALSPHHT